MDVSLESKSLPSVGYSRKSYPKVTSQRLARDKLVHFHGWKSLALPSVGPGTISQEKMVSTRFRRHSRGAAKSFRNNMLSSQGCEVGFHLEVLSFQLAVYIGHLQKEVHPTVQKGCGITSQQKGDFATLWKMLPSAQSDWLAMAATSSFQLRIVYRLKHWIVDFLSFKMVYSMHQLDLRKFSKSGYLQVKEEIQKQLNVGFLSVVKYPEWLANVVPVPKKDGKILMALEDMEKTSFITKWVTYCYRVMPFGLKNAGATYQRAATTLFHDMMHETSRYIWMT
ncbi:hypothetical protein CK203_100424 [Vitis vinifera]|uniref:Uncharacterized protein n=1 Tax=Vitis vinifera TaxID=29760 RepID=A0A438CJ62_VITVI|nr:hypothetical protein CK203_100424 [Vitis vinifera]